MMNRQPMTARQQIYDRGAAAEHHSTIALAVHLADEGHPQRIEQRCQVGHYLAVHGGELRSRAARPGVGVLLLQRHWLCEHGLRGDQRGGDAGSKRLQQQHIVPPMYLMPGLDPAPQYHSVNITGLLNSEVPPSLEVAVAVKDAASRGII